ncbi:MAG: hypothetical protein CL904_05775 [Dehalococcoidia bacterium]|nr:hypothetical protein [Dehalococcoidia bacterium]MQG15342.1 hypothetical protein [SAR202 cluster bacterium]
MKIKAKRVLFDAFWLAFGIILLFHGATAFAADPITVSGKVTNMSQNGDPLEGLSVVLHENSVDIFDETEYTLSENNEFIFENIIYDPNKQYGVSIIFKGALYGLNLDLSLGSIVNLEIKVFEPIRSDELLKASLVSILINGVNSETKSISVLEIIKLVNDSDLTYVPGPAPMQLLRFSLPEGAYNLMIDSSLVTAEIFQVDKGFGLSASLPPGEHDIFFSYEIPYDSTTYQISKNLRYGAELLRVVSAVDLVGLGDTSHGVFEETLIGERNYNVLEVANITKGESLLVNLENLPLPSTSQRFSTAFKSIRWELAVPVALGIIVIFCVGTIIWLNNKSRGKDETHINNKNKPELSLLNDLERMYVNGKITEENYRHKKDIISKMIED